MLAYKVISTRDHAIDQHVEQLVVFVHSRAIVCIDQAVQSSEVLPQLGEINVDTVLPSPLHSVELFLELREEG